MRQRTVRGGRILYVMKCRVLAAIFGAIQLAPVAAAAAQSSSPDTLRLSIEEAVSTGLKMADEVRLTALQADITDAQFDAARGALVPTARLTSSFGRTYSSARSLAHNSFKTSTEPTASPPAPCSSVRCLEQIDVLPFRGRGVALPHHAGKYGR